MFWGPKRDTPSESNLATITSFVPADWKTWQADLDKWKQGHVLGPLPLTWIAPEGNDPVTGVPSKAKSVKPRYSTKVTAWCIIASQTCDIAGSGTGANQPFVMVIPLINSKDMDRKVAKLAAERRVPYFFPVLDPAKGEEQSDEKWFADLRMILPISKALLLGRDPIQGLRDEDHMLRFGAAIGHKFRRPALHSALSDLLPDIIAKHITDTGISKSAFRKVDEIRIFVSEGDRLVPKTANLIILSSVALTDDEQQVWRDCEVKCQAMLKEHEIQLAPLRFSLPEEINALTYRSAAPIRVDGLPAPQWM